MVFSHSLLHVSYSLRVLALCLPPTTIIASARRASSSASVCLIWVAEQMVGRSFTPGIFCARYAVSRSHFAGGNVVCATTSAVSIGGSASISLSSDST